jgi:uncharacterized membrane protein
MLSWGQIFWYLWDWLKRLLVIGIIVWLAFVFYRKLVVPITDPLLKEKSGNVNLLQR